MNTEKPTPAEMDYLHEVAIADNWLKDFPKRSAADACAINYADSDGFLMLMAARGTAAHERFEQNQIRNLAVQYLADRAKILPSSCSLSHPEIRYTGETCPLCEALKRITHLETIIVDYVTPCDQDPSINLRGGSCICPECDEARAIQAKRAALSRPSSDPGAGCVKECRFTPVGLNPAVYHAEGCNKHGEWCDGCQKERDACICAILAKPAPGAGEVGK